MTVDRLKALVANDFEAVNALIHEKSRSEAGLTASLSSYIIESGGKRLRPLLVLLSSYAAGYAGTYHISLAAMIEFIHTATLLHDDVIDDSSLRRGRSTANTIWGSKASILVGDYLLSQSLDLMLHTKNWPIIELLVDTMKQLSLGEVKQLFNRHNYNLSTADYFEIIRSKTALLFATSAAIGPILSESSPEICYAFYNYGLHLGNAFQLIDDALDYSSDAEALGKNVGDDFSEGVITMPLIHALQNGTAEDIKLITDALKIKKMGNYSAILSIIHKTQAIEATQALAALEIDKALSNLIPLPDSEFKKALVSLAQFAIERDC